jgi:hypothetical protein
MGCVQDTGDSEFEFEVCYDIDAAAETIAKYITALPFSKYVQNAWEITTLFNGEELNSFIYDSDNDYVLIESNREISEELDVKIVHEVAKIYQRRADEAAAIKEKKRKADEATKANAIRQREIAHYAEYLKMEEKYEK